MNTDLRKKIIIAAACLIVFFAVVNLTGFSDNIKNAFYVFSAPIQKVFWNAGNRASNLFETIYNSKNLKSENDYLKQENQRLLAEIARIENIRQENKILRTVLDIGLTENFKIVLCDITAKQGDFILVDKGSDYGILEDMPVVTAEKIVCGKVSKVYKNFSQVMLLTNKESSFGAEIQEKNASGLIKGKGSGSLYFERVSKDKEIQERDIVVTTSLGGIFPKGLLAGEIKKIRRSDAEPFQQAELSVLFNLNDLESLFIITDY
ncbi:rod shape-determining protein MreC [Candidatus Parcubacteria bacterium]|jgi:rod shape-determining protein MreC|nr:rod shape-determining protein MreC [Candidatus Parcubacteria bacterium]